MDIKIPKQIILDYKLSEKRALIYSYFFANRTHQNETMLSCNYIVEWCGYKTDYHKNKINELFTELINLLAEKNYFKLNSSIDSVRLSVATLNLDFLNNTDDYTSFNLYDLNKIKDFRNYTDNTKKMSASILLLIYSYLKMNSLDNVESIYKSAGDISRDLGVSERYISRALKILCSMELIKADKVIKIEYCIYKFLDISNNVIYVGKTATIESRLRQHFSNGHLDDECYDRTDEIHIHKFRSQMDMDIYEIYYINKYNPIYNTALKSEFKDSYLTKLINEIHWTFYSKSNFYKILNDKEV